MDEIVTRYKSGEEIKVMSYNVKNKFLQYKSINWADLTRKNADIIEIEIEDGVKVKLTPDHKVFTENRGYINAKDLNENDILLSYE